MGAPPSACVGLNRKSGVCPFRDEAEQTVRTHGAETRSPSWVTPAQSWWVGRRRRKSCKAYNKRVSRPPSASRSRNQEVES